MYCTNCGDFIASDENFCGKCGMPAPDCDEIETKSGSSAKKLIIAIVSIVAAVAAVAAAMSFVASSCDKLEEIKKSIRCKYLK